MIVRATQTAAALAAVLGMLACTADAGGKGAVAGSGSAATYANPVLDRDFPDPTVLKASDGWYYAYATQGKVDGRQLNIQLSRSRDLVHWSKPAEALPGRPAWAANSFWAPHVIHDEAAGRYVMYFSAQPPGPEGKCLGVATARAPTGPFVAQPEPLLCGKGFVNIDPMAFDDPRTGQRLLYWGSGFEPLKVQALSPDRLTFAAGSKPVDVLAINKDRDYDGLLEGSWVVLRNGYYYLFSSGNNCCGVGAHYAVMVARSRSPTGPFERLSTATGSDSSTILVQNAAWKAPGHNSIVTDGRGQDWIIYHAIHPRDLAALKPDTPDVATNRVMLIDRIVYRDGWPRIEGDGPSAGRQPAPTP